MIWPAQAFLGLNGICGGAYAQTYSIVENGIDGVIIDNTLRNVTFDPDLATLGSFTLKLEAKWTVGITEPTVYTYTKTIPVKVISLWSST